MSQLSPSRADVRFAQAELQRLLEKPPTRQHLSDFDRLLKQRFKGYDAARIGDAYRALWTRGPKGRVARRVAAKAIVKFAFRKHPVGRALGLATDFYDLVIDKPYRPAGFDSVDRTDYDNASTLSLGEAYGSTSPTALDGLVGLHSQPPGPGVISDHKSVAMWREYTPAFYGRGQIVHVYTRGHTGPIELLPPLKISLLDQSPRTIGQPFWSGTPEAVRLPAETKTEEPYRASWRYRRLHRQIVQASDPDRYAAKPPSSYSQQKSQVQPSPEDFGFTVPPSGPPVRIKVPPHRFVPPKAGEKERKLKVQGKFARALKYALMATEAKDLIEALIDAAPSDKVAYLRSLKPPSMAPAAWDAYIVFQLLGDIDAPQAMRNILFNEANDKAVGAGSSFLEGTIGDMDERTLRNTQKFASHESSVRIF